uniref:Uncharacterized protein n=1 Tax=Rhizophora mucronata TaxID=61149 RepID=A0A2P2NQ53_RHIMU
MNWLMGMSLFCGPTRSLIEMHTNKNDNIHIYGFINNFILL